MTPGRDVMTPGQAGDDSRTGRDDSRTGRDHSRQRPIAFAIHSRDPTKGGRPNDPRVAPSNVLCPDEENVGSRRAPGPLPTLQLESLRRCCVRVCRADNGVSESLERVSGQDRRSRTKEEHHAARSSKVDHVSNRSCQRAGHLTGVRVRARRTRRTAEPALGPTRRRAAPTRWNNSLRSPANPSREQPTERPIGGRPPSTRPTLHHLRTAATPHPRDPITQLHQGCPGVIAAGGTCRADALHRQAPDRGRRRLLPADGRRRHRGVLHGRPGGSGPMDRGQQAAPRAGW